LLLEDPGRHPDRSSSELAPGLQRVARLSDELHITANRVARFGYDEHPFLSSDRVTAPAATRAVLGPGPLLFQLDLTATRLLGHLDTLSAADWMRTGRMGDRIVTLGELVSGVVYAGIHDLLDLLGAASILPPAGVAPPDHAPGHPARWDALRSVYSPMPSRA
jgi:hypothetical protein